MSLQENESSCLGCKPNEIGTQSIRKGAATYCTGMMNGPSIVQIFIRAGWSLGQIQDRYLFNGNGGDQFVGRVVCGLNNTSIDFQTLPPHFITNTLITNEEWNQILPNYNDYPHCFKQVALFLLASIVYHEDYLRSNLCSKHPLFIFMLFIFIWFNFKI